MLCHKQTILWNCFPLPLSCARHWPHIAMSTCAQHHRIYHYGAYVCILSVRSTGLFWVHNSINHEYSERSYYFLSVQKAFSNDMNRIFSRQFDAFESVVRSNLVQSTLFFTVCSSQNCKVILILWYIRIVLFVDIYSHRGVTSVMKLICVNFSMSTWFILAGFRSALYHCAISFTCFQIRLYKLTRTDHPVIIFTTFINLNSSNAIIWKVNCMINSRYPNDRGLLRYTISLWVFIISLWIACLTLSTTFLRFGTKITFYSLWLELILTSLTSDLSRWWTAIPNTFNQINSTLTLVDRRQLIIVQRPDSSHSRIFDRPVSGRYPASHVPYVNNLIETMFDKPNCRSVG